MTLLLIYLFLAVFVSFMCSLLEAVILSVTPSYIETEVKDGKKFALILQELKEGVDRPLAAILTLNTIAHTVGAAGVGAQVSKLYGNQSVAVASAVLTFVVLIFSEIIPKTLGASNWKKFAPMTAYTIRFMILTLYPLVFLMEKISDMVGGDNKNIFTREEMIATAEIGVDHGALKRKESNIIKNLLMLDNIYVYDIMTPRSVLMALDGNLTIEEVMEQHKPIRYSRIPVFEENMDDIRGVVHRYQILEAASNDQDTIKLNELKANLHTVPEDISVSACLDQLIHRNDHIFLVVDDYGSTMGIVTLEDAIETLLGVEIIDEFDSVADLRAYALEQWKKRKKTAQSVKRQPKTMSEKIQILYVTVASTEEGKKIASELLNKKLIACANLMPSHTAIYPWEGKIEEGSERILLLKTQRDRVAEITAVIQTLHSYDCPCILNWESGANTPFASWVNEVTNK